MSPTLAVRKTPYGRLRKRVRTVVSHVLQAYGGRTDMPSSILQHVTEYRRTGTLSSIAGRNGCQGCLIALSRTSGFNRTPVAVQNRSTIPNNDMIYTRHELLYGKAFAVSYLAVLYSSSICIMGSLQSALSIFQVS